MPPFEYPWQSPFNHLRIGRIDAIYYDEATSKSETLQPLDQVMGNAKITWMDWYGGKDNIKLSFGSVSNDVVDGVGFGYGDLSMPSKGTLAVIGMRGPLSGVILGYLPINYFQQTSTALDKDAKYGTLRRIIPGEFSRQSRQQAELYHDQAGAIQIIVRAQPTLTGGSDGSGTTTLTDISPDEVPSKEIARITFGETYETTPNETETFAIREIDAATTKKVITQIKTTAGATVNIDTDGNITVAAASGKNIIFNSGTKGTARLDDATKSTSTDDSAFWNFISALVNGLVTSSVTPLDGGASYKAGIIAALQAVGVTSGSNAPQSLTGKITSSSNTVLTGD